jgi:hypothetical protein
MGQRPGRDSGSPSWALKGRPTECAPITPLQGLGSGMNSPLTPTTQALGPALLGRPFGTVGCRWRSVLNFRHRANTHLGHRTTPGTLRALESPFSPLQRLHRKEAPGETELGQARAGEFAWGLAVVNLAVLLTCPCSAWIDWTARAAQTCPFGTSQTPKGSSLRQPARLLAFLNQE